MSLVALLRSCNKKNKQKEKGKAVYEMSGNERATVQDKNRSGIFTYSSSHEALCAILL